METPRSYPAGSAAAQYHASIALNAAAHPSTLTPVPMSTPQQQQQQQQQQHRQQKYVPVVVPSFLRALILFTMSIAVFCIGIHWIFISKLLPPSDDELLSWVRKDRYYGALLPLLMPSIVVFVFLNWLGMKYFRHN
ncbi:hypothetical protein H696_05685 [Fonticula alba]|uniref:Uncharacterized protein n=1 Tax=Fonticula alba TaxID=691883 RepID=A0A058Z143_FONAL|nr:hypothetical protein H696_05685 [Fonticula alba]KCV67959.1 hypothetical protein H696_05685 [Fonticula alba]|eukprot:XP_009497779.1 hypothetical protein H696_05685 [Fonticula alba]